MILYILNIKICNINTPQLPVFSFFVHVVDAYKHWLHTFENYIPHISKNT